MIGKLPFRSTRPSLRAAIFLGMVPLVILNGWPVAGCICADGHYEASCPGCVGRARHAAAEQKPTTRSCCGRACCARAGKSESTHSCCKGHKSCCKQAKGREVNAPAIEGPCCTPVAQTQVIPVVSVSPAVVDHHQAVAVFAAIPDLPSLAAAVHHGRCVEIDTGPPPNDLVVTLQRLII